MTANGTVPLQEAAIEEGTLFFLPLPLLLELLNLPRQSRTIRRKHSTLPVTGPAMPSGNGCSTAACSSTRPLATTGDSVWRRSAG